MYLFSLFTNACNFLVRLQPVKRTRKSGTATTFQRHDDTLITNQRVPILFTNSQSIHHRRNPVSSVDVHKSYVTKYTKDDERVLNLRSLSAAPTESNLIGQKNSLTHCYHVKRNGRPQKYAATHNHLEESNLPSLP